MLHMNRSAASQETKPCCIILFNLTVFLIQMLHTCGFSLSSFHFSHYTVCSLFLFHELINAEWEYSFSLFHYSLAARVLIYLTVCIFWSLLRPNFVAIWSSEVLPWVYLVVLCSLLKSLEKYLFWKDFYQAWWMRNSWWKYWWGVWWKVYIFSFVGTHVARATLVATTKRIIGPPHAVDGTS